MNDVGPAIFIIFFGHLSITALSRNKGQQEVQSEKSALASFGDIPVPYDCSIEPVEGFFCFGSQVVEVKAGLHQYPGQVCIFPINDMLYEGVEVGQVLV